MARAVAQWTDVIVAQGFRLRDGGGTFPSYTFGRFVGIKTGIKFLSFEIQYNRHFRQQSTRVSRKYFLIQHGNL